MKDSFLKEQASAIAYPSRTEASPIPGQRQVAPKCLMLRSFLRVKLRSALLAHFFPNARILGYTLESRKTSHLSVTGERARRERVSLGRAYKRAEKIPPQIQILPSQ